jgi:uncharacterized protein YecE (DUF72 family)
VSHTTRAASSTTAISVTISIPDIGRDAGCDVFAYFNNDIGGHAPRDAMTLRRVLEEQR